jgi:aryl-alcohol dehydrogenase
MQIQAAVARAALKPVSLENLELSEPRDDEVLVRVVATGICHTDIAMRDQIYPVPQPIVLGHEGAGIVEDVGRAVSQVSPGDHVVMTFNSCGICESCLETQPSYCHDFFGRNFSGMRPDGSSPLSRGNERIHGSFFGQSSFATHAICTERNAIRVPKDTPLEILGPLACGIQTGAGSVINALKIGVGKSFAVFGVGSVGLSAIMAARLVGAGTIIGVDLNPLRLEMALQLGATHTIHAGEEDVRAALKRIMPAGVHYALETTGNTRIIRQAVESLGMRGECGLVGASKTGTEISLDVLHIMTAGRKIRGIVEGDSNPEVFIRRLIELNRQGRFPYERLIRFYELKDINDAIHDAESGTVLKPIVRMSSS